MECTVVQGYQRRGKAARTFPCKGTVCSVALGGDQHCLSMSRRSLQHSPRARSALRVNEEGCAKHSRVCSLALGVGERCVSMRSQCGCSVTYRQSLRRSHGTRSAPTDSLKSTQGSVTHKHGVHSCHSTPPTRSTSKGSVTHRQSPQRSPRGRPAPPHSLQPKQGLHHEQIKSAMQA
jgi:hypothetical protein